MPAAPKVAGAVVVRVVVALAVVALAAVGLAPQTVAAQEPTPQDTAPLAPIPVGEEGWNSPRVLELAERARERRREPVTDSLLRNYRADVTGHIYFFIDREDEPEPVLLRADQVALELYWAQPDHVRQVIHGMRSEKQFPIRDFRYYLDRYTVIQNGFDDMIRVGEGRDVRNVRHPLAPAGRNFYDFRLGDSTTIRLPGQEQPIRVYEIQVRPRNFDRPGIVGSLFVERARGDLVRLAFTFTPASYIDDRNERVEVMLENALWEGRYWLPREQRLLVRREIPEIDLDVGTVIRGALRVRDYELNMDDLPEGFFGSAEVVMAGGPEQLASYDFDEGLYEGLGEVGLEGAEPGTLDAVDVDAIAGRILRDRFLRGVPRLRFFAPSGSDVIRFDRAEGLVTGAGAAFGVGRSQAYLYGGWAWGSGEPLARVGWRPAGPDPSPRPLAEAYLNRPLDLGLRPATSGVFASLSAALLGRDYRDILPATGAMVGWRWGESRTRTTVSLAAERIEPTEQARTHALGDEERRFRPVPPAVVGDQIVARWSREQRGLLGPVTSSLRPRVEVGWVRADEPATADPASDDASDAGPLLGAGLEADAAWTADTRRYGLQGRLAAATALGHTLPQHARYIGGPNTLPGHSFHRFGGTTTAAADLTAWREVVPRWLRVRGFGAVGWAGGESKIMAPGLPGAGDMSSAPDAALEPWEPGPSDGLRASVGFGVGLVDDILRIDYALPTDSWDGVIIISVDPDLWSFL